MQRRNVRVLLMGLGIAAVNVVMSNKLAQIAERDAAVCAPATLAPPVVRRDGS